MERDYVKITNTVYGVLDFLPDSDPLKNRAKEKALAILEHVTVALGAPGWASLKKDKAASQAFDDIDVLMNYLEIGKYQGWINSVNFLIIKKQYDAIKNSITPQKALIVAVSPEAQLPLSVYDKELAMDEKEEIDIADIVDIVEVPDNKNVGATKEELAEKNDPLSPKAIARQEKILKILSEKEKAQVADFIKELPNITKRTVRRDLDDLLKRGKVVRVGEWNQVFYQIQRV